MPAVAFAIPVIEYVLASAAVAEVEVVSVIVSSVIVSSVKVLAAAAVEMMEFL